MTQLNQIVAVAKGKKAKAARSLTDAYHVIQKAAPLNGLSRTYEPKDEDGDRLPGESVHVQVKVEDLLKNVSQSLTDLFDVELTREVANASATADVKVDGSVIVHSAPVTYLLFLEKQLNDIRTFVNTLPVLALDSVWHRDENQGLYVTEPVQTARNVKVPKVHVLYEATKEHPAQTQAYNDDVLAGIWTVRKFSGAIPQTRKDELLERVDKLIEAVKFAREEANSTEVTQQHAGASVFEFLFS